MWNHTISSSVKYTVSKTWLNWVVQIIIESDTFKVVLNFPLAISMFLFCTVKIRCWAAQPANKMVKQVQRQDGSASLLKSWMFVLACCSDISCVNILITLYYLNHNIILNYTTVFSLIGQIMLINFYSSDSESSSGCNSKSQVSINALTLILYCVYSKNSFTGVCMDLHNLRKNELLFHNEYV